MTRKTTTKLANDCLHSIGLIMANLAAVNIQVGAIRKRRRAPFATRNPGDDEFFRITRLEPLLTWGDAHKDIRVAIYGVKRRRDGSYGTHEHWVESVYL